MQPKVWKLKRRQTNPPGVHHIIQCGVSVCLPPRSLTICFLLRLWTQLTVWAGSVLCSAEVRKTLAGFSRACTSVAGLTSQHVVVCPHNFMRTRSTAQNRRLEFRHVLSGGDDGGGQWASWMLPFANHPTFHKETRAVRWRCETQDREWWRLRKCMCECVCVWRVRVTNMLQASSQSAGGVRRSRGSGQMLQWETHGVRLLLLTFSSQSSWHSKVQWGFCQMNVCRLIILVAFICTDVNDS